MDEKTNFTKDIERREILLEIRRQVDMLEGKEKEIIKLYFGFYDDKQYSQREISKKFGISRAYISITIAKTLNRIGEQLHQSAIIEPRKKIKRKNSKTA